MNSYDPNLLRRAFMEMAERIGANCFLTFSFGHPRAEARYKVGRHPGWHPTPPQAVRDRVRDYFDQMVTGAGGLGFVPNGLAYGFQEGSMLNPHLHVVAALNNPQWAWVEKYGKGRWRKLSNNGQLHVEEIDSPQKVLSYCTKRFTNQAAFDNLFLYPG